MRRPKRSIGYSTQTLARLAEIPGVQSAAVCLTLPYERALNVGGKWVNAKPGAEVIPIFNETYVTNGYFDTFRIPLVRGRYLNDGDRGNTDPVMVVNQEFVRRNSPLEDPIGRQLGPRHAAPHRRGCRRHPAEGGLGQLRTGERDARCVHSREPVERQHGDDGAHVVCAELGGAHRSGRCRGSSPAMARSMEQVDPQLPFAKFRTIDDVRGEAVATPRARAVLLGSLAALALLLSAIGLYGLVANSVAERTRELGIRIALGATPAATVRVAALPGLVFGGIGLAVGLALARDQQFCDAAPGLGCHGRRPAHLRARDGRCSARCRDCDARARAPDLEIESDPRAPPVVNGARGAQD